MCGGPYKLHICMKLALEYSRQGHLSLVFIWKIFLVIVWKPVMYPNAGK